MAKRLKCNETKLQMPGEWSHKMEMIVKIIHENIQFLIYYNFTMTKLRIYWYMNVLYLLNVLVMDEWRNERDGRVDGIWEKKWTGNPS